MAVSSVSYTKTPQAGDDSYWYTENELLAASNYDSSSNVLTLNVMSNDLGGNAKKLYSIDDGSGALSDLLTRNVTTGWETTLDGNQIRINAGKIEFKFATGLDSLAVGDTRHDSFLYAIQLGNGTISYARVTVDVTGSNDGPRVSAAVTAAGNEGGADFEVDLLHGASDIDQGETATLQASELSFSVNGGAPSNTLPAGLTLVGNKLLVDADGSAFDHLAAGATEVITVSYVVVDAQGASVAQTATITITGTNDAPQAVADTAAGTENQTLTIDVLANDTDVDDGHVLSLVSASAPAGMGSASVVDGKVVFNPGTDFDHLAKDAVVHVTLNYTMTDQFGAESSSTVDVTVTGSNDGPQAVADTAAGTENQTLTIDVLANDTDVDDGHVLSLVSASAPPGMGSASVVDGKVVFNPGTDFDHLAKDAVVHVTLSYTMTDQFGAESSSTVDVTVTGSNDGPQAVADTAAGTENQTLTIDVLANDTDVDDGHVLSLVSASAPVGMDSASVVDGKVVFNPGTDFDHLAKDAVVHVTLNYTMTDQFGAESSSTVDVTVTGSNDGPVAVADTAAGTENQTLTIDVLANDTDVDDGHVLSLVSASAPAGMGSASVVDGKVVFNPGTDFDHLAKDAVGHVTLSYTMTDQFGAESSSTVDVTVTGTNALASISGTASGAVQEATASAAGIPTTGGTLLLSDVDDGEAVFQQPASLDGMYGSFTLDTGSGVWSYQLDNNRAATQALNSGTTVYDTLLVKSYDGTAQQTITVSIQGATDNSAPQFLSSGVVFSMFEHLLNAATKPTGFTSALLGSVQASDADGNALSYSLLSDASGGGFQISAGGAVSVKDLSLLDYELATLIPGGGDARGYALEVAVSDGINAPVTTTLYIEVMNVNAPPPSNNNGPDYIDGGSGNEIISGGGQVDVIFGDGGDDTLRGDSGGGTAKADQLFGGAGNDQLFGDAEGDMLRGGSGNDALTGGAGSDTFVWSLADISGGPYTDTVKDWGAGGTADKLDLRDLLQGEHANALSLDAYLDFSYASGNTTIAVHSAGAGTAVTQSIVLEGIQLAGADDQAIISNLLSSSKLVVDV